MRSVQVVDLTGVAGIAVREIEPPSRAPGEVLIQVEALAPAFPDVLLSTGSYQVKPELPFSPGSDFAGVVLDADAASEFAPGDRVAGCVGYGAASEVISVPQDRVYPLPETLSFDEAAAIPMNYLTAYYTLAARGDLREGQRVLVTGASGGVGIATVQVATALGAEVFGVVSSAERGAVVRAAGADAVLRRDELPTRLRELTRGHGIDVVVDVVGGDVTDLLRVLAPEGRLMIVGFASGEIPVVKTNRLLLGNTDVRGVESAHLFRTGGSRAVWDRLMTMVSKGLIHPDVVDGGGLDQYAAVVEALGNRTARGRAVLAARQ